LLPHRGRKIEVVRKIAFIGEDHPVGLNLTNSFSVRKDAYSV